MTGLMNGDISVVGSGYPGQFARLLDTESSPSRPTRTVAHGYGELQATGGVHSGPSQFHAEQMGPGVSIGRAEAFADRARERLLTTRQFSSPVADAVAARTEELLALG